jgi:hypothetical protein
MGPMTETMSVPTITDAVPVDDDDAEVDWRDLV